MNDGMNGSALRKYAEHEAEEGTSYLGKVAEEAALGVEGVALLWSVRFAHILEIVFSRQFCILLKLCWAILAIIKAHRFVSERSF